MFAHLINGFELFWMKVLENVFLCWKSNIRRHIYDDFRFDSCGKQIRIIDIYKRSLLHNSNLLRGSFSEKSNKCALLQMGIVFVNLYGNQRETIGTFFTHPMIYRWTSVVITAINISSPLCCSHRSFSFKYMYKFVVSCCTRDTDGNKVMDH